MTPRILIVNHAFSVDMSVRNSQTFEWDGLAGKGAIVIRLVETRGPKSHYAIG
jgi:hypothetical protein